MARPEGEGPVAPSRIVSPEYGVDYVAPSGIGGGWSSRWGSAPERGMRHGFTETKPFFLTSEFVGAVVVLAALAVTAASSNSLDAGLLWPLATGVLAAFVLSRGFAKAAAPSRSWDPRETLGPWWDAGEGPGDAAAGGATPHTGEMDRVASAARYDEEEETRQMSTTSREEYRMQAGGPLRPTYGYGRGVGREWLPIETKPFFLTSEFWGCVALIVGLAIAAGTSDDIDARLFWMLATAVTAAYVISRGIAKSGTKSRSWDPREELMHGARERVSRQGEGS
jgi:hypothetical protein